MRCLCVLRSTFCTQLPTSTARLLLQPTQGQILKRNLTAKVKNMKLNQNLKRVERRNAAYLLRHTTWKDLISQASW